MILGAHPALTAALNGAQESRRRLSHTSAAIEHEWAAGETFAYFAGQVDYTAARAACLSIGGDLASIHSAAENAAALALLAGGLDAWIGLSDADARRRLRGRV